MTLMKTVKFLLTRKKTPYHIFIHIKLVYLINNVSVSYVTIDSNII